MVAVQTEPAPKVGSPDHSIFVAPFGRFETDSVNADAGIVVVPSVNDAVPGTYTSPDGSVSSHVGLASV